MIRIPIRYLPILLTLYISLFLLPASQSVQAAPSGALFADLQVPQNIKQIATGNSHTCTLSLLGDIKCWGSNSYGELGNGNNVLSNTPVDVRGLNKAGSAISAGDGHTCALTKNDGVKCWGRNDYGQLGNGDNDDSNIPVDVTGLSTGISAITAGGNHTCALTKLGGVKCWGRNDYVQLGNRSVGNSNIPINVSNLGSEITAISAGYHHTCALTKSGGIKCWGWNMYGQLGGSREGGDTEAPVDVIGLGSGNIAISAGYTYTCALTKSKVIRCWGNGPFISTSPPAEVDTQGSEISAISAGYYHACALTTVEGIKCWGGNRYGQLGNDSTIYSDIPVDVIGVSNVITAVSAGNEHTCALTKTGSVKCWGSNQSSQLGIGSNPNSNVPVDVSGLISGVSDISAGMSHACALLILGEVKCWGNNSGGQLGNGTSGTSGTYAMQASNIPLNVIGLSSAISATAAGGSHTCVLITLGGVKCWGSNGSGQLGNGSNVSSNTPVDVSGLISEVNAISAGSSHTCALNMAGGVKCWGDNSSGQLGNGSTDTAFTTPVNVINMSSGVSAISAGTAHTCAITKAGGAKCWGGNNYGQLGNGSIVASNTPVDVSGLSSGVIAISAANGYTCALTKTGGVKCWGNNEYGQLGNGRSGSTASSNIPVDVNGLSSGVGAISAGYDHACALMSAGGVKCWGVNSSGQLGNGSLVDTNIPVDVSGLDGVVSTISAGASYTCVRTTSGRAKCWGINSSGQLGDGHAWQVTPADVLLRCYGITFTYMGEGSNPTAIPDQSEGCGVGRYTTGASISLTAAPTAGWGVISWSGTDNDASVAISNTFVMTYSDHTVNVVYKEMPPTATFTPSDTPTATATDTPIPLMPTLTATPTPPGILPWAIFVYLNGDNNLDGATEKLFNQLELAVAQEPSLKIRVLWDRSGRDKPDSVLYQVLPDQDRSTMASYSEGVNKWSKGELDMGDPKTLFDFIKSSRQDFLASQYRSMLIIVNHGGGWSPELAAPQKPSSRYAFGGSGFSIDQTNEYNYLSTQDMGTIFASQQLQNDPIDIVFYDACLMAMVEEAFELQGGAHYFVASQYEAWSSFPYAAYLKGIQSRSVQSQARWLVDQYDISLRGYAYPHTMSVIDLKYTDTLTQTVNGLANVLDQKLATQKGKIGEAFLKTQKLDYDYDCLIDEKEGYADLGDFAMQLIDTVPDIEVQAAAQSVLDVLHGSTGPYIYYQRHETGTVDPQDRCLASSLIDLQGTTGVSIYLPLGEEDRDLPFYNASQLGFAQATYWDDFIFNFKGILPPQVGNDYVGGRGRKPQPLSVADTDQQTVTPTPTATNTGVPSTEVPTSTPTPTVTSTPEEFVQAYKVYLPTVRK